MVVKISSEYLASCPDLTAPEECCQMGVPNCLVNAGINSELTEERGMCGEMHCDQLQAVRRGGTGGFSGAGVWEESRGDWHVPGGGL